ALQAFPGGAVPAYFQMDVSDRQQRLCILRCEANDLLEIDKRLLRVARPIEGGSKPKVIAARRGVILAGEWEGMPNPVAVLQSPQVRPESGGVRNRRVHFVGEAAPVNQKQQG